MRQRVSVAVAVAVAVASASEPEFLLCDEPTIALDVTVQSEIIALLQKLQAEVGVGLVFVSHDLAVVAQLSQRILVMRGGLVLDVGATRDVIDRPGQDYTRRLLGSMRGLEDSKHR